MTPELVERGDRLILSAPFNPEWRDWALAEREPFRVSEIVEVELVPKVPTLNHQHRPSILDRPADAAPEDDHARRAEPGDGK